MRIYINIYLQRFQISSGRDADQQLRHIPYGDTRGIFKYEYRPIQLCIVGGFCGEGCLYACVYVCKTH